MRHPGIEWVGLLLVFLAGCAKVERFEFTRVQMGVRSLVVVYAPSRAEAEAGAAGAFAKIAALDACMSDYRAESELMKLCSHKAGEAVVVSPELMEVLAEGARVSAASGGAFDVTVGACAGLWREARKTGVMPSAERLADARGRMGWQGVEMDKKSGAVMLKKEGMRLDLGGIAKGYAAEKGVEELRRRGLSQSLVALAGDIAAGDAPPGSQGWRVDVGEGAVLLSNSCISTSGSSEQYVEIGGKRYSHIIDPRTGVGVSNVARVSVIARSGAVADAVATALCVMEAGSWRGVIAQFDGTAVIGEDRGWREVMDPAGVVRWAPRVRGWGPEGRAPPPGTR